MSFYKEDREKSMAAMAADGAGAQKDQKGQKTSVEDEEPKAGVEKATKAETTVSAPPEEPKPKVKVKAVHEATGPSAQLEEISAKLDKILDSFDQLANIMVRTNFYVSNQRETLEAIGKSVSPLEEISRATSVLASSADKQTKTLNELVDLMNEPAGLEEGDIFAQLAEIRDGVLPLAEISTTMRDLTSESRSQSEALEAISENVLELTSTCRGQSGILEAIHGKVVPLTEIPGILGASRDRLDEIGERILSLRADAGAEESTEAERRAVTVYIYPTLDGIKRTTALRQAEEESMDPEMIRSYFGWDVPEENYPKLTDEEINNLSLME